jgi:purine nucleosidase/pyrimidine-specific ribonucleoside hydrolase
MTAAQTNIARLVQRFPDILEKFESIVFMGGSTEKGNVTPYAEFNIICDPESADIVLKMANSHNIKIIMVPLDVTHVFIN